MNAALQSAFLHAHRQTVAEFSATAAEAVPLLVWWVLPDGTLSAGMEAVKGSQRAMNAGVMGMLEMPVDGITLNVARTLFTVRPPRPGDLFWVAPPLTGGTEPDRTHAQAVKYVVESASAPEIAGHYHIAAKKHA